MKPTVLITGATAGIGEATAQIFAQNQFRLILVGRREERLEELKLKLAQTFQSEVTTLCLDVRDVNAVHSHFNALPSEWKNIDVLVNNAGLSQGLEPIHEGSIQDWDVMIDTNIKGFLYVTKVVSQWMVAQKKGHIINIGSIAGKEAYPNGNVYCATKHAVDALNKSMRVDLLPHQIKVTGIHPGAVETEFSKVRFHGDEARAKKVYEGFEPLMANDIADAIWYAASRPAHVNINDMVIMPSAQANATTIHRKL